MTGHRARKRFGQHFLHDQTIVRRIVQSLGAKPSDLLVEIGPGTGILTRELVPMVGKLHAIELDRDLAMNLKTVLGSPENLVVYNTDVLEFDFCRLITGCGKIRLIGNLPYNISTPLLFHILEQTHCIEDMCFMLQKEVVDRLCASPGTKAYGRLGVMIQWRCSVERLFNVKRGAFHPPPKVDSAFVRLRPHSITPVKVLDQDVFAKLIAAVFSQRRKTLRNALREMLDDREISALDINPTRRGETLNLEEFAALSNAAAQRKSL